jgi:CheY-like chemotaxis protein
MDDGLGTPDDAPRFGERSAFTPSPNADRRRIAIIDDELAVCRAVTRLLSRVAEVTTYDNAGAALRAFAAGAAADVLLVDLSMPGIDGVTLVERLAAQRPELAERVIFMTGGACDERGASALESARNPALLKPFGATELHAAIERLTSN